MVGVAGLVNLAEVLTLKGILCHISNVQTGHAPISYKCSCLDTASLGHYIHGAV